MYTNFMQDDWSDWLASAEFAYNNRIHSAINQSPFFLDTCRHPNTITTLTVPPPSQSKVPAAEDFARQMEDARSAAARALAQSVENMKRFVDRKRRQQPIYRKGQMVYLDTENIKTGRPSKKLDFLYEGPFEIKRQVSDLAYELKLPSTWRLHPVFHIVHLRPAMLDSSLHPPTKQRCPPPDIIDDTLEYGVEEILDHRGSKRHRQYKVKWLGYPLSEATWEPKKNLTHARQAIADYEATLGE
jgi:hypothetical protein